MTTRPTHTLWGVYALAPFVGALLVLPFVALALWAAQVTEEPTPTPTPTPPAAVDVQLPTL